MVTLQSVSISSVDAVLQPATAQVAIAVQVYDTQGNPTFAERYGGTQTERLGFHTKGGYEEHTGKLIAVAADFAVQNALGDQRLVGALKGPANPP